MFTPELGFLIWLIALIIYVIHNTWKQLKQEQEFNDGRIPSGHAMEYKAQVYYFNEAFDIMQSIIDSDPKHNIPGFASLNYCKWEKEFENRTGFGSLERYAETKAEEYVIRHGLAPYRWRGTFDKRPDKGTCIPFRNLCDMKYTFSDDKYVGVDRWHNKNRKVGFSKESYDVYYKYDMMSYGAKGYNSDEIKIEEGFYYDTNEELLKHYSDDRQKIFDECFNGLNSGNQNRKHKSHS